MYLANQLFYWSLFLLLFSCSDKGDPNDSVSVKDSPVEIKINRFEKQVFEMDTADIDSDSEQLAKEYGELYKVYIERVLNFGLLEDPALDMYLSNFLSSSTVQDLYEDVETEFNNLENFETSINTAFKRYNVFFPDSAIPTVATFVSGFCYYNGNIFPRKVFVTDTYLALGLDMYLGDDYSLYKEYGFQNFFRQTMDKKYMAADLIRGWMYTTFPISNEKSDLVTRMIEEGRRAYVIDKLLIDTDEYLKFGFTQDELLWCKKNEQMMWQTLINEKLLYEKNSSVIDAYFAEGPFTKNFPKESPARALVWMGKRIVASYVLANNVQINDLMAIKNTKEIFMNSNYNTHQ